MPLLDKQESSPAGNQPSSSAHPLAGKGTYCIGQNALRTPCCSKVGFACTLCPSACYSCLCMQEENKLTCRTGNHLSLQTDSSAVSVVLKSTVTAILWLEKYSKRLLSKRVIKQNHIPGAMQYWFWGLLSNPSPPHLGSRSQVRTGWLHFAVALRHGCHKNALTAQEGAASALTLPPTAVPLSECSHRPSPLFTTSV